MSTQRLRVFVLMTAAYFLSYFFRSANAVIAPDLTAELALDPRQLGLMSGLFFAAFAGMQIPLGVGLDRWGARWVTSTVMGAAAVGSLVFAFSPSFGWAALGRALIGVGMSGVLMGALKLFSRWFSAQRYATVSGLLVGIGSLGALGAATPLAWLNQSVGWRAIFMGGGAITAVVAAAVALGARNAPPGEPWGSAPADAGNLRAVFGDGRFWRIAPLNFWLVGGLLAMQGLWAGPYLYDVLQWDAVASGNALAVLSVGASLGYLTSGWIADHVGLVRTITAAGALFVLAQFGLAWLHEPWATPVLLGLFGLSGGVNVMLMVLARRLFPLTLTGRVTTAVNLFGFSGAFLIQWGIGWIVGRFAPSDAGRYPPLAYATALTVSALGALAALLWFARARRRLQE